MVGETKPIIPADNRQAQNRRTVTEVTGYVTVPRLRTQVAVACTIIQSRYLASYPSCLKEIKPVELPRLPVYPIVTEVGNVVAKNTSRETSTSVSIVNDGTTVTTQTKGSAGNGAVTTDVKMVATADKLVREIKNNGELVMTVTSNPDGSNPQVEWPN